MLGGGAELTVLPFLLGVLGCGFAGYSIGVERFPGTGSEYLLAAAGGVLGVFIGIALAGAAVGALLGWAVGWGLRYAIRQLLCSESDSAFWWPIYVGAGFGGLIGFVWSVVSAVNTLRYWLYWRACRGRR